jgi:hypothetical protein
VQTEEFVSYVIRTTKSEDKSRRRILYRLQAAQQVGLSYLNLFQGAVIVYHRRAGICESNECSVYNVRRIVKTFCQFCTEGDAYVVHDDVGIEGTFSQVAYSQCFLNSRSLYQLNCEKLQRCFARF